jgi:2,3-bisphosphoglycerate-dependent phosphoglycerate mutase
VTSTVTLTRHGESELSARGVVNGDPSVPCPLSARGREQARALASRLADVDLSLVVTSTFPRAIETAELAVNGRGVPSIRCADLDDLRFGRFEGGPVSAYRAWSAGLGAAAKAPGGGESRRDAVIRYCTALRQVLMLDRLSHVLVVAHGLPLAYIVRAVGAGDLTDRVEPLSPGREFRVSADALAPALDTLQAWAPAGEA